MVPKVWFDVICPTINNINMSIFGKNWKDLNDDGYDSLMEYERGIKPFHNDGYNSLTKYERGIKPFHNDGYDSLMEYERGISHFKD
jgi:hypothetical protein